VIAHSISVFSPVNDENEDSHCHLLLALTHSNRLHNLSIFLNLLLYGDMTIYRRIHDMKIRSTNSLAVAIRPRPLFQMAGICALLMLGIALMFLHYRASPTVERIRVTLQSALTPVVELLSSPANIMEGIGENARNITNAYRQNATLKAENAQLLEWQAVAKELQQENAELRGLLGVSAAEEAHYVTARIVSATHDPFGHTLIITHDGDERIRAGLPVISAEGLVGRVLETTGHTARVLLITDRQSRVPVQEEGSDERGILTGLNEVGAVSLNHVEHPKSFHAGDRIVTSKSLLFPVHFVVGEVKDVDIAGVHIRPYADARKLRFVSIVVPTGARSNAATSPIE
jgi:rod shape-determining protein MreC